MTDKSQSPTSAKIVFSFACYLLGIVLVWSAFIINIRHPLHRWNNPWFFSIEDCSEWITIGDITSAPYLPAILFLIAVLVLLMGYSVLLRTCADYGCMDAFRGKITLVILLSATLFALLPPFLTTDPFSYFRQGWIVTAKNANPYLAMPKDFADLPFSKVFKVGNEGVVSPYGPIWTHISAAIVRLSGNDPLLGLVLFKVLALITYFMTFLVCQQWSRSGDPKTYFVSVLVLSNPLFLLEGLGMAHNDGLAIMITLAGLWLYLDNTRFHWIGLVIMFAAGLVKVFALPAFLLALYHLVKNHGVKAEPWMPLIPVLSVCCLVFLIVSYPFVHNPSQYSLMFSFAGAKTYPEIALIPAVAVKNAALLLANAIGLAVDKAIVTRAVYTIFYASGAILVAVLLLKSRSRMQVLSLMAPSYAVGVTVLHYFRQWYVMWPVAFCVLCPSKLWTTSIVIYSVLALLTYLVTHSSSVSFY